MDRKVTIEVWRGIASVVSAPEGALIEVRDLDSREVLNYRMGFGNTLVLLEKRELSIRERVTGETEVS